MTSKMSLSERQMQTMRNVKFKYGQLCNKRTLRSLEKKGLLQWHPPQGWIFTELGFSLYNQMKESDCFLDIK